MSMLCRATYDDEMFSVPEDPHECQVWGSHTDHVCHCGVEWPVGGDQ